MKNILKDNIVYYTIVNKNDFVFDVDYSSIERLETLQSRYILNLLLNQFNIKEDNIYKTKLGKPYFKSLTVRFNYSHSTNYIACAISNSNVGIDIEETDRIINKTMKKVCAFEEGKELEELVKRESFCKLTGDGVAMFFQKNYFDGINKNNLLLKKDNYICSIYSDCSEPLFQFIDLH